MLTTIEQELFEKYRKQNPGATQSEFLEKRAAARSKFPAPTAMVHLPSGGFFATGGLTSEEMRAINSQIEPPDR
jgi:hypothetical protein